MSGLSVCVFVSVGEVGRTYLQNYTQRVHQIIEHFQWLGSPLMVLRYVPPVYGGRHVICTTIAQS